jgi:hypothetical protein
MTIDIISDDPRIQAHYEKCLAEGTSPRLAEMFAFAQPLVSKILYAAVALTWLVPDRRIESHVGRPGGGPS